jgi:hypothetical protein
LGDLSASSLCNSLDGLTEFQVVIKNIRLEPGKVATEIARRDILNPF